MAQLPPVVTVQDVQNPTLLVRLLRGLADKVTSLSDKIDASVNAISFPSFAQIRNEMLAGGTAPLNVNGLRGVLGDAQPSSALRYSSVPSGQTLQNLRDTQLITVGSISTSFDLYTTVAGNPNTLFKLIGGVSGGSMMTTDTNQTIGVNVVKTWTSSQIFSGGLTVTSGQISSSSQFSTRVYNSANQSIGDSALTAVTFDTESFDQGNCHDTGSNTSRITVPTGGAGLWLILGQVEYASNATGSRTAKVTLNGATSIALGQITAISGVVTSVVVSTIWSASDADYFELSAFQSSGGALNVIAGVGATWFAAYKLC